MGTESTRWWDRACLTPLEDACTSLVSLEGGARPGLTQERLGKNRRREVRREKQDGKLYRRAMVPDIGFSGFQDRRATGEAI